MSSDRTCSGSLTAESSSTATIAPRTLPTGGPTRRAASARSGKASTRLGRPRAITARMPRRASRRRTVPWLRRSTPTSRAGSASSRVRSRPRTVAPRGAGSKHPQDHAQAHRMIRPAPAPPVVSEGTPPGFARSSSSAPALDPGTRAPPRSARGTRATGSGRERAQNRAFGWWPPGARRSAGSRPGAAGSGACRPAVRGFRDGSGHR